MHLPGVAGEDAMRSARLFASEVIPRFRDETALSTTHNPPRETA
jgi:hypothetical protein